MVTQIGKTFDLFLDDRRVYCSPETIKTYQDQMLHFWKFLDSQQFDSFQDVPDDFEMVQKYILYLQSCSIKNVSIRSYCRSLKAFLRWAYSYDYCRDFYKRPVKLPKDDSSLQMPLFQDEVQRLDSDLSGRNYVIVHLMLDCGLRSQEVRHLRIQDILFERNIIQIINSKGQKSRLVLAPDFLLTYILKYIDGRSSGYVVLPAGAGDQLSDRALKDLFVRLRKRSGIGRLHAHLLRHTFGTSYLIGGGNLEFLRVFMGHSSYNVTKIYTQTAAQCKMLGAPVYQLDPIFFQRGY